MSKKTHLLLALLAATATFSHLGTAAEDDSIDTKKWTPTTVQWIVERENDLDLDHKKVCLTGKVTKQINGDSYQFEDKTASIRLDSDIKLPLGKEIIILGDIDQAFLHIGPLEVNVHDYRLAPRGTPARALPVEDKTDPVKNGS